MTHTTDARPIELTPPDIGAYAAGNTGIPYIWRFDSGKAGPRVMISAVVHGNELCGAIALDWLLRREVRPIAGSLTLAFMNVAAFQAFDPADPDASRFVDEDFNRVWDIATLESDRDSVELRRARAVRPALADIDYLLDIHSMQHPAPPLMMSGRHDKARNLARQVGLPERVVGDAGHAAGRRMRDYDRFDDPAHPATALLVECGQHWAAASADLAKATAARFLTALGCVDKSLADPFGPPPPQHFYTVQQVVTVQTDAFRFTRPFHGGEVIETAGTIIAHDGEQPVTTAAPRMMLVMPSRRLHPGQTALRLAVRCPD